GGLVYMSGYINGVRQAVPDALLIDGGDAVRKGDLIGYLTNGELAFEAMARMGYDAIAVGNNEHNFGLEQIRRFGELSGDTLVTANLLDANGEALLPAYRMVEVSGLRVALIGMARPRGRGTLGYVESGYLLGGLAAHVRREEGANLVIVTAHVRPDEAHIWAHAAPEADIFITGHSDDTLFDPEIAEGTGAIILLAGAHAERVGRLELAVSGQGKRIISHAIIEMDHGEVAPDEALLSWLSQVEADHYPGAREPVADLSAALDEPAIARELAEALRSGLDADIGLADPAYIIHHPLPTGPVSANDVFRVLTDRGQDVVEVVLTGAELAAYLDVLGLTGQDIHGENLHGLALRGTHGGGPVSFDPARSYSVAVTEREWSRALSGLVARSRASGGQAPVTARPADASATDLLVRHFSVSREPR
ncbi:MAG TPA: hypothetical protein DF715_04400, partial [Oceanicaulis sp.]|nr:hypothetical protein [Oceanicaulis sp.]